MSNRARAKWALLEDLSSAIRKTMGDELLNPINIQEDNGKPVLLWEGPHDWTMIAAGSSLFAGELGRYSDPTEERIQKVIDKIEESRFYLETINHYTLAICE